MIGFHLRLAQSASFHAFARRLDRVDVSPGWFAVLALIGENPGITQTALSRADTRDKSSLSPILDDLDRRGLITRERLPSNRRSYSLNLTQAGVKLRDELMKHARAHEHELDQIVGPGGKADLIGTPPAYHDGVCVNSAGDLTQAQSVTEFGAAEALLLVIVRPRLS